MRRRPHGEGGVQEGARPAERRRGVAADRDGGAGVRVEAQVGGEAGHRARVPVDAAAGQVLDGEAEAVAGGPGFAGHVGEGDRPPQFGQGGGGQDAAAVAGQERAEPNQVGGRGPQGPRRGHRPVLGDGLGVDEVGVGVHGDPDGVPRGRHPPRAGHAERRPDQVGEGGVPGESGEGLQQPPEDRIPNVAVVEAGAGGGEAGEPHRHQGVPRVAPGPLPPGPGGLRGQPGGVRHELGGRRVAAGGVRHPGGQRAVQVERAGVRQREQGHGDLRLGDRGDAVLGVRPGAVSAAERVGVTDGVRPHDRPVDRHRAGQRRLALVGAQLLQVLGEPHVSSPGSAGGDASRARMGR